MCPKICRHPWLDPGSPELGQSQGIAGLARNDGLMIER